MNSGNNVVMSSLVWFDFYPLSILALTLQQAITLQHKEVKRYKQQKIAFLTRFYEGVSKGFLDVQIENFCEKISAGKKARLTDEFMIIARIESLILKQGMDDAVKRAKAYLKAGADGIMIHSRESEPDEIFEFCDKFKEFAPDVPLVVVPTSFNQVYEDEFAKRGVNIVIYANHLIRSSYPAMVETANMILENERCKEADDKCLSIKEILTLIPDE